MFAGWNFFRAFVSNVEMTLVKTDLGVARRYVDSLVPPALRRRSRSIEREYARTVEQMLRLTGEEPARRRRPGCGARSRSAMPTSPRCTTCRSRCCAGCVRADEPDDELRRALLLSVNGIAAGLRNTG